MEISRQKLRASIIDSNDDSCPTCSGSGFIKSLSSQSISLVRMLEEEAVKNEKPLTVYLPVRLATYLLNEKRDLIKLIENNQTIPENYRFKLFEKKDEIELLWNGKSYDTTNVSLPFTGKKNISRKKSNH